MSGNGSLVDVSDLRPIRLPANADPATNPDNLPGLLELRNIKWRSEAKTVIAIAPGEKRSPKKISVLDKENIWPEGVAVSTGNL